MEPQQITEGARVSAQDSTPIGTVDGVDAASHPPSIVVRLESDARRVRIPFEQVDWEVSSPDRIVADVPGERLLRSHVPAGDGVDVLADRQDTPAPVSGESLRVSVAAEELTARTHEVEEGRVVIRKRVETAPVEQVVDVSHDEVDVERVAVGRDVDAVPEIRYEGDTMVVPIVEEVLVMEKRLHLVEEMRITKRLVTEQRVVRDELRREVVDVYGENAIRESDG